MTTPADGLLLGRYLVVRRLGAGGMATVFLAEDQRLGRRVAVKRVHADSPEATVRRLEREARLGASLNHPNIVAVYDVGSDDDGALVVMEYVEGETLAAALRRGPLSPERALEVVRSVAAALDHAHETGVVHRDVKPGNVLLGADGTVKLVDLGVAHAVGHARLTLTGAVLGTASYMAPEQLEGGRVGPAADVYALAAVAFEALSGRRAREGSTPVQAAHAVVSGPPPDLTEAWPGATPELAAVIARGMERDPKSRPSSAGELVEELSRAIPPGKPGRGEEVPTGQGAGAEPTRPLAPQPEPANATAASGRTAGGPLGPSARAGRGRSLAALAAAACLAIALGAVVVVLLSGAGEDGTPSAAPGDPPPGDEAEDGSASAGSAGAGSAAPGGSTEEGPAVTDPGPLFATEAPGDPARGAQLNEQGKSLVDQGDPEAAVPILQQAVRSFPEDTTDLNYAFALFNLGNALRLSGNPEAAIPVLERRLEIPNQRDVVRAELRRARSEAGG